MRAIPRTFVACYDTPRGGGVSGGGMLLGLGLGT